MNRLCVRNSRAVNACFLFFSKYIRVVLRGTIERVTYSLFLFRELRQKTGKSPLLRVLRVSFNSKISKKRRSIGREKEGVE